MSKINLHTLVLMVGPSGAGKSTATDIFEDSEIVSSDAIRAELLGDFRIQSYQDEVWAEVHRRVRHRLAYGQRAVVDATNLRYRDRRPFIEMAQHFGVELVYMVVNRPLEEKLLTGDWRLSVPGLIERHEETFKNNLKDIMRGDGVAHVIDLTNLSDLQNVYERVSVVTHVNHPSSDYIGWWERGVIVIGDVHGNFEQLQPLIVEAQLREQHILFLGDIIDYGSQNLAVFDLVYSLVKRGQARMIWGNHERKLTRWLDADFGRTFKGVISAGMAKTVEELETAAKHNARFEAQFTARWRMLLSNSRQHFVNGRDLYTHGAATTDMWKLSGHSLNGVDSNMAFFGEVDSDKPMRDDGYPNRTYRWVDDIPAYHTVVVGHDPRDKLSPLYVTNANGGRAIFLDTGSSKGGKLSYINVYN